MGLDRIRDLHEEENGGSNFDAGNRSTEQGNFRSADVISDTVFSNCLHRFGVHLGIRAFSANYALGFGFSHSPSTGLPCVEGKDGWLFRTTCTVLVLVGLLLIGVPTVLMGSAFATQLIVLAEGLSEGTIKVPAPSQDVAELR